MMTGSPAPTQRESSPQGEELQQGRKRRDHQRRLDENHLLVGRQTRRAGDDDGRRDAADDHGHHMLHRQGKGAPERGNPI